MTKDIWDEKPELVWVPRSYYSKSKIKEDDIQMILIDHAWLEKLRAEYDCMSTVLSLLQSLEIVEKRNKEIGYDWLVTGKFNELREKAENWDQYAIYDNDKEEEILVKDLITAYEKLEAVKTYAEKISTSLFIPEKRIGLKLGKILEAGG